MAVTQEPPIGEGVRIDGKLWARLDNGKWYRLHRTTTWEQATKDATTIDEIPATQPPAYKQLADKILTEWREKCGPYRSHTCEDCVAYQNELTELHQPYYLDSDEYAD